jgi:hypothetical protein
MLCDLVTDIEIREINTYGARHDLQTWSGSEE